MPRELTFTYLHKLTRHTNFYKPHSNFISGYTFPLQNTEILDKVFPMRYRNHKIGDRDIVKVPSSGRPSDDGIFIPESIGPDDIDPHDIYEDKFRIIRADNVEPYRLIAISIDYSKIIVSTSKKDDNGKYYFLNTVMEYPMQINEFVGLSCADWYRLDNNLIINSLAFRVDAYEECYTVLMEILGNSGYVRFILEDECSDVLIDFYNIGDSISGKNPDFIDKSMLTHTIDITNDNDKSLSLLKEKNEEQIIEFRKTALEGYKIYGTI